MTLPVDPDRYAVFLVAMLAMAFTPGPANLFAVATGMEKGKRAALQGVVGMNAATLMWFAAAALGLGALIAAFPLVFEALGILGGAFLLWLAIGAFRSAASPGRPLGRAVVRPGRSALRDGFAVQAANPKILLFFTGVLPPFIDAARPAAPQLAMFAAGTIGMDVIAMTAFGLGGAALSAKMQQPGFRRLFALCVGLLLSAAAVLVLVNNVGCDSRLGARLWDRC